MSCTRFDEVLAVLSEPFPDPPGKSAVESHLLECAECSEGAALLRTLRLASPAFASPDPGPAYWAGFGDRLEARLGGGAAWSSFFPAPGLLARLGLAFGSCALLALTTLAVFRGPSTGSLPNAERAGGMQASSIASTVPPLVPASSFLEEEAGAGSVEAALLAELEEADPSLVGEALEGLFALADPVSTSDLTDLSAPLLDEISQGYAEESPYGLFLDLPSEDRGLFLEGIRGERG